MAAMAKFVLTLAVSFVAASDLASPPANGGPLPPMALTFRPCTVADYSTMYTQCTADTSGHYSRARVVYRNTACNGTAGISLDSPELQAAGITSLRNLPCNCHEGSFLNSNTGLCQPCAPGSYNIGGIRYDDTDFATWTVNYDTPDQFNTPVPDVWTVCEGADCDGWGYDFSFGLESGNNWNINNIKSEITMMQDFVFDEGNAVSFQWRVNCETCYNKYFVCDGFSFWVDNQRVLPPPTDPRPHYGTQLQFTTFTYNLTKGIHMLQWIYDKDFSFSAGEDKAFVRWINLIGASSTTHISPASCRTCPVGTISNSSGATGCTDCNWFEFAPAPNSSVCLPCGPNTISAPASQLCQPQPPCSSSDYYLSHPPTNTCVLQNGVYVGNHIYDWMLVGGPGFSRKICSNGTLPPPLLASPCTCDPGQYITIAAGDTAPSCQPCPPNTFSDGTQPSCTPCLTYAVPVHSYSKTAWTQAIPPSCTGPACLATSCVGDCSTGWVPRSSYVSSGRTLGSIASQLSINNLQVPAQSTMTLVCALDCQDAPWDQCQLTLTITNSSGNEMASFNCTQYVWDARTLGQNNTKTWTAPASDTYNITAEFLQMNPTNDPSAIYEARIYSISFSTVEFGGAVSCVSCSAGEKYTPGVQGGEGDCERCPSGQESNIPPTDSCVACSGNTFSNGGEQCMACGNATTVTSGNTACDNHGCTFTGQVSGRLYNFSALSHPGGAMISAGHTSQYYWETQYFYINPCSTAHTNDSCTDINGNPLPFMACQTTSSGVYDLGSVVGFWEQAVGNVVMQFTQGQFCSSVGIHRQSNVVLICDTTAGFGSPGKPAHGNIEEPGSTCIYNFEWRTVYACPVCMDADYTIVHGVCQNGQQSQYAIPNGCIGSRPVTTVPCRTPSASDLPDQGHVFVTATIALNASVSTPDMFPSALSRAFQPALTVPVSAITVVTAAGSSLFFRIDILAYQASLISNITAHLSAVVNQASLGTITGAPAVVNPPTPSGPPTPASSSSSSKSIVAPVVIIVIIALAALIVAGVFYWKNRKLKYQNYRLVKEAGHDNGIANELYDEDADEPPVLRPSGGGVRFLNQSSVNALYGDDDDEALS